MLLKHGRSQAKEQRVELLEKLYVIYKKRWEEVAKAITLEMGAPKDFSSQLQAGAGAGHIKSFIKYLKEFNFEKILGDHAKNQKILYEAKRSLCSYHSLELANEPSLS